MILHEVLRLYPPVVGLFRHTCKPTKVKGYLIPAGVDVQVQTIHIQHDEEYWGEDAQEFKPERFSGGVSRASKNQNAFFSFGWGPKDLHWPKFCHNRSQNGPSYDFTELL